VSAAQRVRLAEFVSVTIIAEFLSDSFQSNLLRTLHDGDAFSDCTLVLGRQVQSRLRSE
jgi:hypothetical protein